ncbi:MAG TPA: septal ring lytic transglycosylase RlpA family protein [Solirubrobacterales bacterium]
MRFILPTVAAAALLVGAVPATAKQHRHHRPERIHSHLSLHLGRHSVLSGASVVVRGRLRPAGSRRVKVAFSGSGGKAIGVRTKRSGAFTLRWSPDRIGSYRVRAFGIHSRRATAATSAARRLTAFHQAEASYYGPGLYGGALACGGSLEPGTIGVANKTLPCGAKVKLRYRGKTITVPVVDRGPYVGGRDFDLTTATKEKLGFPDVGTLLSSK